VLGAQVFCTCTGRNPYVLPFRTYTCKGRAPAGLRRTGRTIQGEAPRTRTCEAREEIEILLLCPIIVLIHTATLFIPLAATTLYSSSSPGKEASVCELTHFFTSICMSPLDSIRLQVVHKACRNRSRVLGAGEFFLNRPRYRCQADSSCVAISCGTSFSLARVCRAGEAAPFLPSPWWS
jgi:hypothetical protein